MTFTATGAKDATRMGEVILANGLLGGELS
jgi:hypothetical protein